MCSDDFTPCRLFKKNWNRKTILLSEQRPNNITYSFYHSYYFINTVLPCKLILPDPFNFLMFILRNLKQSNEFFFAIYILMYCILQLRICKLVIWFDEFNNRLLRLMKDYQYTLYCSTAHAMLLFEANFVSAMFSK